MGNEPKPVTIGQGLKKRRTSLKLSLRDVEIATKIRGKYLTRLEAGDYDNLPNDIYTRGFVGNYADFLGLDSPAVLKQYDAERGGGPKATAVRSPRPVAQRRFIFTPKIFLLGISALVTAAVIGYLYWQFAALASPPKLQVSAPVGDQVIYGSLIDVAGSVDQGADVFVNDSPVLTDANGNFSDKLALQDGVNIIRITAKNKVGKTAGISRNILAHLPKLDAATATVPTAPFDGVAVGVTIKGAAVGLVVVVDGKEAFHGTMLDGTAQTFRGASKIVITTSNAGATSLVITNGVLTGKQLSPLGKDGEVKRNLEFAKDTNFQ